VTDLSHLSAVEAIRLFAARQLSPVDLLDAVQARAEQIEPTVNAFTHTRWEEARAQARAAEAVYLTSPEDARPLEGVLVAIKDEDPIEGWPSTNGSLVWADEIADHTSVMVRRIQDAGGIVHAQTTTPEMSAAVTTISKLWGVTRNPWNPAYSVGGSSGGSGASLAAGTTTLATGSDMAGSIRIPASFNGVVGFKPPYGRVPVEPPFNYDPYVHSGPMTRTVADAILLQNVIAGPDDSDITSLRPKLMLPAEPAGVEGLRIAVSTDLGGWAVDPEVRANTLAVGDALRDAGAVVDEVSVSMPRKLIKRISALHYAGGMDFLEAYIRESKGAATAMLELLVTRNRESAVQPSQGEERELSAQLYAELTRVLARYDALIVPTACSTGFPADEEFLGDAVVEVEGQRFPDPGDTFMTVPFNILSRCPVLAVPSGMASTGIPTGVQIVARTYDDEMAFRVGAAIERERPWSYPSVLGG
jgi:amidase